MNNIIIMAPAATDGQLRYTTDQTPIGQIFVNVPNGRDGYCGMTVTGFGETGQDISAVKAGQILIVEEGELRTYGKERGYGFEVVARKISKIASTDVPEVFKAQISGSLGRDVDIQFYKSGACKGQNSVALYGGKDKPPYWVNVELWGKQAELMRDYCPKGSKISIAGRLKIEHWKDKATGEDRFKLVLVAEKFNPFMGSKLDSQSQQQQTPVTPVYQQQSVVVPSPAAYDEIPF